MLGRSSSLHCERTFHIMEFCNGSRFYKRYIAQRSPFTGHVLHYSTDRTASMSDLVQPLTIKATARLPTHARTHTRNSFELFITTEHGPAILATHASTIHGLTTRVTRKHAYKRHRSERVSSSTTIFATALTTFYVLRICSLRLCSVHQFGYSRCVQLFFNITLRTTTCAFLAVSNVPLLSELPYSLYRRLLFHWK